MKVSTLIFVAAATIGHLSEALPTIATPDIANLTDSQFPLIEGGGLVEKRELQKRAWYRNPTDDYHAVGLPDLNNKFNCEGRYAPYRQEIRKFENDQGGTLLDLYACALKRLYARPTNDPNGYWQLAAIHGRPFGPWAGNPRSPAGNTGTGYCIHGADSFPYWHRPYTVYFEQCLYWNAQLCIGLSKRMDDNRKNWWYNYARLFRLPYWDWALNNAQMPPSFTNPTYCYRNGGLADDNGACFESPFYRYRFPNDYRNPAVFGGAPWTNQPFTLRSPSSSVDSNIGQSQQILGANFNNIRQSTYQMLVNQRSWYGFSNHQSPGPSLEGIHDTIHGCVGGNNNGHMSIVPYSAFDPIFWIHHCNVDRLYAIWQALNPTVRPGRYWNGNPGWGINPQWEDENTGIYPIMNYYGTPYTFRTCRDTSTFCYGYPETQKWNYDTSSQRYLDAVRAKVDQLYGPNVASAGRRRKAKRDTTINTDSAPVAETIDNSIIDGNHYYEWRIDVSLEKDLSNSSTFSIPFFLGQVPKNASEWYTSRSYVGSFFIFAGMGAPAGVDPAAINPTVAGIVPLTDGLLAASERSNVTSLKPEDMESYLEKYLRWRCLGGDGKPCRVRGLKNLKVTVSTSYCTLPTDDSPGVKYGEWTVLTEIVRKIGRDGGPDRAGIVPSPSAAGTTSVAPTSTSEAAASSTGAPSSAVTTSSIAAGPEIASPADEATSAAYLPTSIPATSNVAAAASTSLAPVLL
ncbi:hypothetical protein TWF696_007465 [Orbilia brochopaga]|uniref:tyrosinase n=1 Tax=Orbilia brochopaga TaxID=3140254 RepID=A0AAV9UL21_9PEZI